MFADEFDLSDPGPNFNSAFELIGTTLESSPAVGTYDDGLLTVLDADRSKVIQRAWTGVMSGECAPLITTGFGDIFFWKPKEGVYFLELQNGEIVWIDKEPEWFLDEFLTKPEVIERVLHEPDFRELVRRKGPLTYHNVFTLAPVLALGGSWSVEHFFVGDCATYIEIVGQTLT